MKNFRVASQLELASLVREHFGLVTSLKKKKDLGIVDLRAFVNVNLYGTISALNETIQRLQGVQDLDPCPARLGAEHSTTTYDL